MCYHHVSFAKSKSMSKGGKSISQRGQRIGLDGDSAMGLGRNWNYATKKFVVVMPLESASIA